MALTSTEFAPGIVHAGFNLAQVTGQERSPIMKFQVKTYTVLSTDTSATVTFDQLTTVLAVHADGITQSSAPTFTTNGATLTFTTTAAATGYGCIIGFGT